MIQRLKRYLYLKIGLKEKDFVSGRPVDITIINKWSEDYEQIPKYQLGYAGFAERWRLREDIVRLEEQDFMIVVSKLINRIFGDKDIREGEIELVNRYGFHCILKFKKQHKTLQMCDVEKIVAFLTYMFLRLTRDPIIISVIFAERKLVLKRFREMLGEDE